MSASLRRHGHDCRIIFLKRYDNVSSRALEFDVDEYPWQGIDKWGRVFKYASNSPISDRELELLSDLVREIRPDLVGMTVNTPLRSQAIKVTRFLKECSSTPVVWGGFDPTVNSGDCLKHCDFCCMGEGDETILEMALRIDEGRPFDDVRNLAFLRDGEPRLNPRYPLQSNLDAYPWRDNDPDFKYLIEDGRLSRNHAALTDKVGGVYQAMSARGCPYRCSYCCEATFKDVYAGEIFLRRRSPEDLVAELAENKKRFGIREVQFEDEIFGMNLNWLERFEPLYAADVDLPFTAYIYPGRNIEKILTLLKRAGLRNCCLALESGSERINSRVFERVYNRTLFLHTADACRRLGLSFYTDVITYNPYEEEADLKQTLGVLLSMDGTFGVTVNKLFVLPGTKLAEKMKSEGLSLVDPARDQVFNYYSRLFWITSYGKGARRFVRFLERARWFSRHPRIVSPALVELVARPGAGLRTFIAALLRLVLPRHVLWTLRSLARGRRRRVENEVPPSFLSE